MILKRTLVVVLIVSTALCASVLLARSATAQSRPPYVLNALLSVTGPAAFIGASAAKTEKLIEDLVNSTGGINGQPIRIVVSDDQSNPQVAVQLANDLVAKHAAVIVGPSSTATCAAIAPLLVKTGPVSYCTSPYIDPAPGSFMFSNGPDTTDNAAVVLRYYREHGKRRFAMLNATDATGLAADKGFREAFALPENRSITLVADQHFAPTDISVAAQIAQIKAANPDVLIAYTVGSPFSTIIRGVHDANLDVPVCGNAANMTVAQMTQLASLLPAQMEFAALPSWVQGVAVPKGMANAQALYYKTLRSANIQPDGGYGSVWDMTVMIVDALRHLPPDPSAEQVRSYISKLRGWSGANGIYDFQGGSQRGVGQNGYVMARYDSSKVDFVPVSGLGGRSR